MFSSRLLAWMQPNDLTKRTAAIAVAVAALIASLYLSPWLSPSPPSPSPPSNFDENAQAHAVVTDTRPCNSVNWYSGHPKGELGFAAFAAEGKQPLVIRETVFSDSPALKAWGASYLSKKASNGVVSKVYKRQGDLVFSYWHDRPFRTHIPELNKTSVQLERSYDRVEEMDSAIFFGKLQNVNSELGAKGSGLGEAEAAFSFMYSNPITEDFSQLLDDFPAALGELYPEPAVAAAADADADDEGGLGANVSELRGQVNVWLGAQGTQTPLHSDRDHNLYLQVTGRKLFVLFPPSLFSSLCLYPVLHPRHQQSMLNVELLAGGHVNFVSKEGNACPKNPTREQLARVQTAELAPGDVLYVPPEWFHFVWTLSGPSASVNAWTPSVEMSLFERRFEPAHARLSSSCFGRGFTKVEARASVAKLYLRTLIYNVLRACDESHEEQSTEREAAAAAKVWVRDTLLLPRYIPWLENEALNYSSLPHPEERVFCSPLSGGSSASEAQQRQCGQAATEMADAFLGDLSELKRSMGVCEAEQNAIVQLRLAQHSENVADWAVGSTLVASFLLDFVRCP